MSAYFGITLSLGELDHKTITHRSIDFALFTNCINKIITQCYYLFRTLSTMNRGPRL